MLHKLRDVDAAVGILKHLTRVKAEYFFQAVQNDMATGRSSEDNGRRSSRQPQSVSRIGGNSKNTMSSDPPLSDASEAGTQTGGTELTQALGVQTIAAPVRAGRIAAAAVQREA